MASRALPLADARAFWPLARRTHRIRLALGGVLVALFAACSFAAFQLTTRPTSYFASGGKGIVLLDLSLSVDPRANARLATLLKSLADSDQRLGLVAFEEDAYELLPPGTRGDEIRPMLRFFGGPAPSFANETPWSRAFLGGTNIGRGLRTARQAAERAGARSVLLVSDLEDSASDIPLLTDELSLYKREALRLRVIPLFPAAKDLALFRSLAGPGAIVGTKALRANAAVAEQRSVVAAFPTWLFLVGGALLAALAVNELVGRRLEWSAT
jgi:von Willebrand factor type A domain